MPFDLGELWLKPANDFPCIRAPSASNRLQVYLDAATIQSGVDAINPDK